MSWAGGGYPPEPTMTKPCLKTALLVLTLGIVLYCAPAILPGENDTIASDESSTAESSDLLTITTYTGHPEGHLITFPDGTTMSIDCATGDITTKSHFHVDHCAECGSGDFGQYNRNNVIPGQVIYDKDEVTVTVVAANTRVIGQDPAGPYACNSGSENHWSMALLVKYKRFDYLTAGDLDSYGENPMGAALRERGVNVDVFKVSHHGSSTSTMLSFLLDILPEYAVIAGGGSEPTGETLSNLVSAGVKTIYYVDNYSSWVTEVYRATGDVTITTDGFTYSFSGGNPYFYHGPFETDDAPTPTPTLTPTCTPTWDPSVPTYTPTATPTLRPEGPWPMFRYDAAGTGQSYYFTGSQKGQLAWSYVTGNYVDADPVVGFDGMVYVGSNDNNLYAITSEGALIWSYRTGHYITSAPALDSDGTVHIGSYDDSFYAITSFGSLLWSYGTGGGIRSSAVINDTGKVYVGSDDNMIYAFSPDGCLEWSYGTGDNASSSPAVGSDGNVYTGSEDNVFYALNSDGAFIWSYFIEDSYVDWGGVLASSPALKPDGSICVGSGYGRFYAFSSTGAFLWRYVTTKDCPVASPVIDRSGNSYVGAVNARFYRLAPSGQCRWSYWTGDVFSSAAIDAEGNVYIGTYLDRTYAFTSGGYLTWSYRAGNDVRSSAAIGYDGCVYVGSRDGRVYAFKDPPTATPTITSTPIPTGTPTMSPTSTSTPTAPAPTATPTVIPLLVVRPGVLAVGQNFSVYLALTQDIAQPFDFYLFVHTPAGAYTLYLNGRMERGIKPLYKNVKNLLKDYITTVRPTARIPAGMTGKTVTFYALFIKAGKKLPASRVLDLTPSTPYVIMMDEASAMIGP